MSNRPHSKNTFFLVGQILKLKLQSFEDVGSTIIHAIIDYCCGLFVSL